MKIILKKKCSKSIRNNKMKQYQSEEVMIPYKTKSSLIIKFFH